MYFWILGITNVFLFNFVLQLHSFKLKTKNKVYCQAVVAHAFNPSTWEGEAGRYL